jgi:hypothetical protein
MFKQINFSNYRTDAQLILAYVALKARYGSVQLSRQVRNGITIGFFLIEY